MASVGNVLGPLVNLGVRAGQTIVQLGSQAFKSGTFKTLLENAGKFVSNTAQLIMGGFQKIDFSNAASHILSIVNPERWASVTKLIADAGERLKNIVPTITNGFLSGNIGENINQILQSLGSFNPLNIVSGLTDKINSLRETIKVGDGKTILDTIQLGNFGQFLTEKFGSIQERFATFQGQLQELGVSGIISQKLEEAKSTLGQSFEQFTSQIPGLNQLLGKTAEEAEAVDQAQGDNSSNDVSPDTPKTSATPATQDTSHGQLEDMPSWFQNAELVDKKTGEKYGNVIGQYEDGNWLVEKPDGTKVAVDTGDNKYKNLELKEGSWDEATFKKEYSISKENNTSKTSQGAKNYKFYDNDNKVAIYDKSGNKIGDAYGESTHTDGTSSYIVYDKDLGTNVQYDKKDVFTEAQMSQLKQDVVKANSPTLYPQDGSMGYYKDKDGNVYSLQNYTPGDFGMDDKYTLRNVRTGETKYKYGALGNMKSVDNPFYLVDDNGKTVAHIIDDEGNAYYVWDSNGNRVSIPKGKYRVTTEQTF